MPSAIRHLALKDEVVLKKLPAQEQETLMRTANRIWEKSVENAEKKNTEKQARYENFKRKFRIYLLNLPQEYRVDAEQIQNGDYDHISGDLFNELSKIPSSNSTLFNSIRDALEQLGIIKVDMNIDELSFTQRYLDVFKALWGDGIPPYLSNLMHRTEVLDQADVLKFWKMSLRHNDLYKDVELEEGQTIRDKAEKELMDCIETDGVFDEVMKKIFPGGLPKLLKVDLGGLTITELQKVWQSEEGTTVDSWEKKHMAYVKLMIIYAVSQILGTIDFKRKKFLKEQIGKFVKADLKSIVSSCLKLLSKYLDDSTEPDPSKIKDTVRIRIDVVFPEGVLETGDPTEIKYYVVRRLAAALAIFGTSYDESRLRNSYVKKGINNYSGKAHLALQTTVITSCDYREDGSITPCPEAYPLEMQFPAALSAADRKVDDKFYNDKKLEGVRKVLGVDIEFFQYVNHLADLFINEPVITGENSGGTVDLSDKERLGIKFLQILATDDPKTFKLLKDKMTSRPKVYQQKFIKAFKALENYWVEKYRTYITKRLKMVTNILEGHDGVEVTRLNHFVNISLGIVEGEDCDYGKLGVNIEKMILAVEELTEDHQVLGQRIVAIGSDMKAYVENHQEVGSIQELIKDGEKGLARLLA